MRFLLALAVLVVGCGSTEPLTQTASPLGCWRSLSGHAELDLRPGGAMQFLDGDNARIVAGTWSYEAAQRELVLSTEASRWQVTGLTSTEMWTDSGVPAHWHTVACE
jgi:hypothetical protein